MRDRHFGKRPNRLRAPTHCLGPTSGRCGRTKGHSKQRWRPHTSWHARSTSCCSVVSHSARRAPRRTSANARSASSRSSPVVRRSLASPSALPLLERPNQPPWPPDRRDFSGRPGWTARSVFEASQKQIITLSVHALFFLVMHLIDV